MSRDKHIIQANVRINAQQRARIERELRGIPGAARKAMVAAISRTTRATITRLGREVRSVTTLKSKSLLASPSTNGVGRIRAKRMPKPKDIAPFGIITISGKQIPLIEYGGNPKNPPQQRGIPVAQRRPKIGAGFKIYRSDSLRRVRGYFVQRPKSGGSPQIMKESPESAYDPPHIRYGPSVASVVNDRKLIENLQFDVVSELDKQIASQIDRFLNRSRGRRMR